ncbi:MAG: CarD family transcriptional regulator [Alphaproteobacteria bacterium]|nr:CarD family transcriptional regulator [Alphaproteobacteria bacterium]
MAQKKTTSVKAKASTAKATSRTSATRTASAASAKSSGRAATTARSGKTTAKTSGRGTSPKKPVTSRASAVKAKPAAKAAKSTAKKAATAKVAKAAGAKTAATASKRTKVAAAKSASVAKKSTAPKKPAAAKAKPAAKKAAAAKVAATKSKAAPKVAAKKPVAAKAAAKKTTRASATKAGAGKAAATKATAAKPTKAAKKVAATKTAAKGRGSKARVASAAVAPPANAIVATGAAARAVAASIAEAAARKISSPIKPVKTPTAVTEKTDPSADAANKKAVSQRHGFKTNEHVVYPAHGVGRIIGIEEQEIAGMALELFVINFEKEKLTLRVPTGKLESVGLRKLAEEKVVEKALGVLKGRARVKRTMWSRRAQEYVAKINSGDIIAIAEVVRDLYRSEAQPEQSYSERQLYEDALDRMAREVAAVLKLDESGSIQRITDVLSKSARSRRAAEEEASENEGESPQAA